jgi:hypothetical protein
VIARVSRPRLHGPGIRETSEYWYVQSISTGYPKSIIYTSVKKIEQSHSWLALTFFCNIKSLTRTNVLCRNLCTSSLKLVPIMSVWTPCRCPRETLTHVDRFFPNFAFERVVKTGIEIIDDLGLGKVSAGLSAWRTTWGRIAYFCAKYALVTTPS